MRKRCCLGLALIAMGCGKAEPPRPTGPEFRAAAATAPALTGNRQDNQAAPITHFAGRDATQWAGELKDADHAVRSQASQALGQLGDVGYPHLAEGLRSKDDAVRLACLQAMSKPVMLDHHKEMVPLLQAMLGDREPMIRRSAAARLCWFGSEARAALPQLRLMAQADPVLDIRQVAAVSVEIIQNPKAPPPREQEKAAPQQ